jgi:hypothetical protein
VEATRKELLGRPRRKFENTIEINFREIVYAGIDWIELTQDKNL